jgi:hypothetical protein
MKQLFLPLLLFSFIIYAQNATAESDTIIIKCHDLKDIKSAVQVLNTEVEKNVFVTIDSTIFNTDNFQFKISNNASNKKIILGNGALLKGYSVFIFTGENIHLKKFDFERNKVSTNGAAVVSFVNCFNCSISNCRFSEDSTVALPENYSYYISFNKGGFDTVEHCKFENKYFNGGIIVANYLSQDEVHGNHYAVLKNYFGERAFGSNPSNFALRLGSSGDSSNETAAVKAFIKVSNNIFDEYNAYTEIISNKSSNNIFIDNYFNRCAGYISLRSGSNCIVKNNRFKGEGAKRTSGIFVSGPNHTIQNNYFENLTNAAIFIVGGNTAMQNLAAAEGHHSLFLNTDSLHITGNTFVNTSPAITFVFAKERGENFNFPRNCKIEKNVFYLPNDKDLIFFSYQNPKLTPQIWRQVIFDNNVIATKSKRTISNLNNLNWDVNSSIPNIFKIDNISSSNSLIKDINKRYSSLGIGYDSTKKIN